MRRRTATQSCCAPSTSSRETNCYPTRRPRESGAPGATASSPALASRLRGNDDDDELDGTLMEFGIFHEFLTTQTGSQTEAFRNSFTQIEAAERWGLDVVWLAEIHMNPTRSLLSAPLTGRGGHCRQDQPHQDRHGGADLAARPSAAPCRGDGDDRPDQRRPADLRGWPQRLPTRLQCLRHLLRREPGPLCRSPRHHQKSLDARKRLAPGPLAQLREFHPGATPRATTASGNPHRSEPARYLFGDRRAGLSAVLGGARQPALRTRAPTPAPTARRGRRPVTPASRGPICKCRFMSPRPARRRWPTRRKGSCGSRPIVPI